MSETDSRYYSEPERGPTPNDDLRKLLRELASGHETAAVVVYSERKAALYGNDSRMIHPGQLRAIREAGFKVTHAGTDTLPRTDGPNVTFARSDAEGGESAPWVEFKEA